MSGEKKDDFFTSNLPYYRRTFSVSPDKGKSFQIFGAFYEGEAYVGFDMNGDVRGFRFTRAGLTAIIAGLRALREGLPR